MTDKAVMMGDYVDLKFLPGLKSARVFVDIPIEHSNTFLKMFDAPDRTNPVKVAIARIQLPAEQPSSRISGVTKDDSGPQTSVDNVSDARLPTATKGEETADKPSIPFRDKPRSVQAALMCRKEEFEQWMRKRYALVNDKTGNEPIDHMLKRVLGIASKRELDCHLGEKAMDWDTLLTSFDVRSYI